MSKKRRVFDIDMPEEQASPAPETFPAGKIDAVPETKSMTLRRGPMATAIGENSRALQERRALEEAIRKENDALAAEHVRLKKQGLIVDLIPLDLIDAEKLTRDRAKKPDMDLEELKDSIREIGLSNPIRVEPTGEGRYELVQGMRRLSAFRELHAELGGQHYALIPAGLVAGGETLDSLYRRMVDENMVRKDISFGEMAELARAYVADPKTDCTDPDKAVAILYRSAGYQKRTYIRSFITLLDMIGHLIEHPHAISRNLGLALKKAFEENPALVNILADEVAGWNHRATNDELDILRKYAGGVGERETFPAGKIPAKAPAPRKAKTTFQIARRQGTAKCAASNGRLEIRLPVDFSALERRRLEEAVRTLLDGLE